MRSRMNAVVTGARYPDPARRTRRPGVAILALLALAGVVAACGGSKTKPNSVVYALEAENPDGWCLPEAQLTIVGMQIARAIYDPLTMPDKNGEFKPYLAKTLTHDPTYTKWEMTLREGVKFHDGSDLTAQVVKNNIDAFRGQYPKRKPLLFVFVMQNLDKVTVTGPLSLTITTHKPWPALPGYLYANSRFGIMAQSQLDSPNDCDTKLVGTGPFKLKDWVINDHLSVTKNKDYWQKGYPKLDEITFRPSPDSAQRTNGLAAGEYDIIHTTDLLRLHDAEILAKRGEVNVYQSDDLAEVSYLMLNSSKPPFNNECARLALAHGSDRKLINEITNGGFARVATGPFGPGSIGFSEANDQGFPKYDPKQARSYLKRYLDGDPTCPVQCPTDDPSTTKDEAGECKKQSESKKKEVRFTLTSTADPGVQALAKLVQALAGQYGIKVDVNPIERAQLVNDAIAGDFQGMTFRNHSGGEPDGQYVWFSMGSPTNFARFIDPKIQALLDKGRATADRAEQQKIYSQVVVEMNKHAYDIWAWWTKWGIVTNTDIEGKIIGPTLPDGSEPSPAIANGNSLLDLCVKGVSCGK